MSEEKHTDTQAENRNNNQDSLNENMHLFVYGNLKISDKETGQILVNKPF
jgi:hypothetical protein